MTFPNHVHGSRGQGPFLFYSPLYAGALLLAPGRLSQLLPGGWMAGRQRESGRGKCAVRGPLKQVLFPPLHSTCLETVL